jgi:hypothetical protein
MGRIAADSSTFVRRVTGPGSRAGPEPLSPSRPAPVSRVGPAFCRRAVARSIAHTPVPMPRRARASRPLWRRPINSRPGYAGASKSGSGWGQPRRSSVPFATVFGPTRVRRRRARRPQTPRRFTVGTVRNLGPSAGVRPSNGGPSISRISTKPALRERFCGSLGSAGPAATPKKPSGSQNWWRFGPSLWSQGRQPWPPAAR